MTWWIFSGHSFVSGGDRAPKGPCLPILAPTTTLLDSNISAGARITRYLSKKDPRVPCHKRNLAHGSCPNCIFSQTCYDLNRQGGTGAQEWGSSIAWQFGSWGRATHSGISGKARYELGKTLNNTQATRGPATNKIQISETLSSSAATRTSSFPCPLSLQGVLLSDPELIFMGEEGWLAPQRGRNPSSHVLYSSLPETFLESNCSVAEERPTGPAAGPKY